MPELVITDASGRARRHALTGPVTLGRDIECEIVLDDLGVSRRHANVHAQDDGYVIQDLGSKNGTVVNNASCSTARLEDGDEVLLGSARVIFVDNTLAENLATSVVLSDQAPSQNSAKYSRHGDGLLLPQQRLRMLYDLSERVTLLRHRDELLEEVLNICFETLQFERGAIAVRNADGRGVDWPVVRNLRGQHGELSISRTVLGRALDHGERAVINDTGSAEFDPTVSMVQQGICSALCVPILEGEIVAGVIYGDRTTTGTIYSDEDVDFLAGLSKQVSIAMINARLMEEQKAMLVLEREIALARRIQQRLFPDSLPCRDDVQVAASNEPGRHVSGDYYDVIELSGNRLAFIIADVTGEGVAAALLMSNLQAAVRLTLTDDSTPAALLIRWNDLLYHNTEPSKFATCLCAILDVEKRTLTMSSAGHFAPYVAHKEAADCFEIEIEPGFPLGVVEDAEYFDHTVTLSPGPCNLFCYTDGVIEAMNEEEEHFGMARTVAALHSAGDVEPAELIRRVSQDIAAFCGSATQSDDITTLAVHLS